MELKCVILPSSLHLSHSLNRTFMELKSFLGCGTRVFGFVLIEPLWNWNLILLRSLRWILSLNRTFMELKLRKSPKNTCSIFPVLIEPLWNWNVSHKLALFGKTCCLNRTFMELKYAKALATQMRKVS